MALPKVLMSRLLLLHLLRPHNLSLTTLIMTKDALMLEKLSWTRPKLIPQKMRC